MGGASNYMTDTTAPYKSLALTPRTDFSQLGTLLNSYVEGTQQSRQLQQQSAFRDGLPNQKDKDGNPVVDSKTGKPVVDTDAVLATLARLGGTEYMKSIVPFVMQQQAGRKVSDVVDRRLGSPQPGSPEPGTPNAASNAAGPANLRLPAQQPQGEPQQQQQPQLSSMGTDNKGADTLRSTMTELSGGRDVSSWIPQFSTALRIDPDAPLQPGQVSQVKDLMRRSAGSTGAPAGVGTRPIVGQPNDTGSASQPAQAAPANAGLLGQLPAEYRGKEYQYVKDLYDHAQEIRQAVINNPMATKEQSESANKIADGVERHADKFLDALKQAGELTPEEKAARNPAVAEDAARREELKKTGDELSKLATAGIESRGHAAQLNVIDKLGSKVDYGVVPKLQSFLGRYGIETKGLSDIQAYERAIDYMAPQLRPIGSGRLMQTELAAFKSSLGGLMTTKEGRQISVNNLKLISGYNEQIGRIAADTSTPMQERMSRIYALQPPRLQTEVPNSAAPGGQGAPARPVTSGKLPKGDYVWTPQGLRPAQ